VSLAQVDHRGTKEGCVRIAVIGSSSNDGTVALVAAWQALGIDVSLMPAAKALAELGPGDVALVRLDVVPALDGVEGGLLAVSLLERRSVRVLNPVDALLGAHDKLRTARLLRQAGVPHPATVHVSSVDEVDLRPPFVVKPRYGSWGTDVALCRDAEELRRRLNEYRARPWFRRHGAIVQEAIPSPGHDLRVIVAGGCVVGAAERVSAPGEWRTNISCGGSLRPAHLTDAACELARTAAAVVGGDLVGVDLMPDGDGFTVLELNAAVDFDFAYSLDGGDVYASAAAALGLVPVRVPAHATLRSVLSG
jgi:RimK family alpha-L-glutamate ligase